MTAVSHHAEPTHDFDFSGLKALFINCTLKKSPALSHTEGLVDISRRIMEANGVATSRLRAVDHDIAYGVWPDMTEHGAEADEWPALYEKVMAADILVLGSAIWLGEKTSVCTKVIERLYGNSSILNEDGQYAYYGKVGGCLITGNEDGAKTLLHEYPVLAATPRLLHPAAGGRRMARRSRTGAFLSWTKVPVVPKTTSPTGTQRS